MKLILATCTILSSTTSSSPCAEADLLDPLDRACSCAHAGKNTPNGGGRGGGEACAFPREKIRLNTRVEGCPRRGVRGGRYFDEGER